MLKKLCIL